MGVCKNIKCAISSNIYCHFNKIFHEFKILKKVITTETFNVDGQNKLIKFWIS